MHKLSEKQSKLPYLTYETLTYETKVKARG